jgi:DNA polymerase-3 subunit alpha (Gram-positive type)
MIINVIDIETTGFDPYEDKILEIGIVEVNTKSETVIPFFHEIVWQQGITGEEWIFKNSSLTPSMVSDGISWRYHKDRLQYWLNRYPTTAFNSDFDFAFLKARDIEINGLGLDPMLFLTDKCKIPCYRDCGFQWKWPSVEEAYEFLFNYPIKEPHRALGDAIIEGKIMLKIFKTYPEGVKKCLI